MATQHPDNAAAPFWNPSDPFIGVHQELADALACYKEFGMDEFMWDWEGKYADSAVVDKLFSRYHAYFSKYRLGRDKFLTFRIPNIWEEKGYSLLQAMSVILSSEDFARDLKFSDRPLFEVILPMTERADQLMQMHKSFEKLAQFKTREFDSNGRANTDHIELIPLVESVEGQQSIGKLLQEYLSLHTNAGRRPEYIRPFLARSDPALVSGLLATVLANRMALSQVYEFSAEHNIPVFPISGVGSLPFRGGLTPDTVEQFATALPGVRTVSLQSSFRYDHSPASVKAATTKLEGLLPQTKPQLISAADQKQLARISGKAAAHYQETLGGIAPDLMGIFAAVPKRRERRQHIGLLAYGRSMGSQQLPRAITFTAGLYSIGVPPEFIGVGRALADLSDRDLELVRDHYPALTDDLDRAGRYLNTDNLKALSSRNAAWRKIHEDIDAASRILGVSFGPRTQSEKAHRNLTANVLLFKNSREALTEAITETALLRRSLG
ncbi:MAG: phosphoenolpyruvate carboxylase [Candidatus Saccharibacteria bacterium]|jgi:phosphoenolpyruvate carboxylase|nr:phosphoenolpyruvate carboxylase [Candidatus Saccharibacteria bacterium]